MKFPLYIPHKDYQPLFITLLFLFLFLFSSVTAQQAVYDTSGVITVTAEKEWDLFGRDRLVHLSLFYNGKVYRKNRYNPAYQKAILRIQLEDSNWVDKPVKIKARGEFRRNYCSFPPFKLNIKKAEFDNEYLDKTGAMKFVTQCKHSREYEGYLLREYLIYKIYNILTDTSFRARLVEMTYVDSSKKKNNTFTKYGFLIEPLKSVAKRLNAVPVRSEGLAMKMMAPEAMARVALFEYMIGNTDWSVAGQHNIKVLKILDAHQPHGIPVPYDFDYCGLVDASYALPAENSGLQSVRQRLYRGICLPETVTEKTSRLFLDKKDQMEEVIRDFPYLDEKNKKEMIDYLEEFFNVLKDKKVRHNIIFRDCISHD